MAHGSFLAWLNRWPISPARPAKSIRWRRRLILGYGIGNRLWNHTSAILRKWRLFFSERQFNRPGGRFDDLRHQPMVMAIQFAAGRTANNISPPFAGTRAV